MNYDDDEGELDCPICLIPLVEDSGIETVQSDIEGVVKMILDFSESQKQGIQAPDQLKLINKLLERASCTGKQS